MGVHGIRGKCFVTFMINKPTLSYNHWWEHSSVMTSLCQNFILCASIGKVAKVTESDFDISILYFHT